MREIDSRKPQPFALSVAARRRSRRVGVPERLRLRDFVATLSPNGAEAGEVPLAKRGSDASDA
jgi:hypothetical protein